MTTDPPSAAILFAVALPIPLALPVISATRPSNLAISVMQNRDVEVIAGVNLPMLVKLARVRAEQPIKQAVRIAAEAGRKYINVANDVLDS